MEDFIVEIKERHNKEGVKTSGSLKISEDGSTLICGYPVEECAIIFTKQDDEWVIQQKLTESDGAGNDLFGYSVSLSSDGNIALVGAIYKSSYTGAAYIFTRSGSTWTQQAKLTASDGAGGDYFGYSVSISSDGNTAKIYTQGGREYTFTIVDGTWVETTPHQPNRKLTMKLSNLENKVPNDNGFRAYLNNVEVGNIETSTVEPEVGDPFTLVTIRTIHMDAFEFLDQDLELAKRAIPGTMVYHIDATDSIPYRLVVTVERTATEEEFLDA